MTTVAELNQLGGSLAELLKEVKAGNEVLLTENSKPVAKLIPAHEGSIAIRPLRIRSLSGHRVLKLSVSQAELADELFGNP